MEDGERIPIDVGPVAEAVANTPGETLREDGTLVVDLMAQPSCQTQDTPEDSDKIVVCAVPEEEDGPQAVRVQITENADATLLSESHKMPMGGSEHQATVRLRLEF